jgi:hypothetical protein
LAWQEDDDFTLVFRRARVVGVEQLSLLTWAPPTPLALGLRREESRPARQQ